ncbi:putative membrane protein [Brucella inopinata]|nr:putative membrane protein [Brucella inopinata]
MGRAKPYWNIPAKTFDDPGIIADWARLVCGTGTKVGAQEANKQKRRSDQTDRRFYYSVIRSHAGWNQHEGRNIVSKTNRSRTVIIAVTAALVLFGLRLAAAFFI